ncbi:uncharacterized protein LOC133175582 [Saccostrea echinata]|uniref:uncharacterized protein LOC133175582 n=1 Tax=Saccostrea echinata TaxID=191078 RepID=UPI002A82D12A|nr:uncharacterized protein LOC133175582 [Saccostrea echinata]
MDPRTSAQNVIHCDLCETVKVQMHCDTCLVNLCKACVGEHISAGDESKDHKVVKYQSRNSTPIYPECTSHEKERCEMFCRKCDISVCASCLSSDQHISNKLSKILEVLDEKKDKINKYKTDLNENVNPKYLEMASNVQNKISELEKEYGELLTSITKQGEVLQREIDKLVNKLKNQIDKIKSSQLQTLQKILDEINRKMIDIKQEINLLDIAKDSNDISKIINLRSTVDQHKIFPQIPVLSAPKFTPKAIQEEELCSHFGDLSLIPLKSKEHGNIIKTTKNKRIISSPPLVKERLLKVNAPQKKLRNEPELFDQRIYHFGYLRRVAWLSDEKIWTCDNSCTMTLYSINQGSPLKSIRTRTINSLPSDIAVTKSGELVYTDICERTVNIVKNENKEEVIRLNNWKPLGICSTSSGDLLVTMESDDNKQSKVVRYSDSTEKQSIQFVYKGTPLYSSDGSDKLICENRNLDICVADSGAKAIVVVNQFGKLRFKYSGHTPAPWNRTLNPRGITTDSQSNILTTDYDNNCVHIIDQNGRFLQFLEFGFYALGGLCTNSDDYLFLISWKYFFSLSSSLEKIKYLH